MVAKIDINSRIAKRFLTKYYLCSEKKDIRVNGQSYKADIMTIKKVIAL